MTDDDPGQITACPGCDCSDIVSVVATGRPGASGPADHGWFCKGCGEKFDEPVERERHRPASPRTGLAGRMEDPEVTGVDDLVTDGGTGEAQFGGVCEDE